ncbi:MAG: hypothetical protein O8C61_04950 [Candidatus Methanoperedens sp.]|nr:hypothetical protein [Candidatus Methanoperedens sp.]
MTTNKVFVFIFIIMLTAFPASASDATLNRWVINVTLNEDGIVDELVQVEIGNPGSNPIDGFSFVVPASNVTVIYDLDHTFSSKGQVVEQLKVQNGIKLIVNFDSPLNSGETWNGRIGFRAENFAKKSGNDYALEIPLNGPQTIASGKATDMKISSDLDLRGQVFLPKGVEVLSVTPKPFRILFQNSLMVPTWTPMNLKITDTISLKGSFSDVLKKIADVDERSKILSKRIKEANIKGLDVGEAQAHLKNAEDFNTNSQNSALSFFWAKDEKSALEFIGYAQNELDLAETSFSSSGNTPVKPTEPVQVTPEKSPAPGVAYLVLTIMGSFMVLRTKRPKP